MFSLEWSPNLRWRIEVRKATETRLHWPPQFLSCIPWIAGLWRARWEAGIDGHADVLNKNGSHLRVWYLKMMTNPQFMVISSGTIWISSRFGAPFLDKAMQSRSQMALVTWTTDPCETSSRRSEVWNQAPWLSRRPLAKMPKDPSRHKMHTVYVFPRFYFILCHYYGRQ